MVGCYNALVAQAGTPDPRQDADEISTALNEDVGLSATLHQV
jgi:hypothetical protein